MSSLLGTVLVAFASGCFTVYHPLNGLQRAVAIDPALPNFTGQRLRIRCFPSDDMDAGDAAILCRSLERLFTAEGASVETEIPRPNFVPEETEDGAKPELTLEIASRLAHEENSAFLWLLCIATATLLPAITDGTFEQTVTLRDADGSVLLQDTLRGRFVRYFGLGLLAINALLDLGRAPADKLTNNQPERDFSRDFYAQLSQLVFHAQMRTQVLHAFSPPAPPRSPTPAASP